MATNKKQSLADKGKKAVGRVANKAEKAIDNLQDKFQSDNKKSGTKH